MLLFYSYFCTYLHVIKTPILQNKESRKSYTPLVLPIFIELGIEQYHSLYNNWQYQDLVQCICLVVMKALNYIKMYDLGNDELSHLLQYTLSRSQANQAVSVKKCASGHLLPGNVQHIVKSSLMW